jgi:hypothetical protein
MSLAADPARDVDDAVEGEVVGGSVGRAEGDRRQGGGACVGRRGRWERDEAGAVVDGLADRAGECDPSVVGPERDTLERSGGRAAVDRVGQPQIERTREGHIAVEGAQRDPGDEWGLVVSRPQHVAFDRSGLEGGDFAEESSSADRDVAGAGSLGGAGGEERYVAQLDAVGIGVEQARWPGGERRFRRRWRRGERCRT